MKKMICKRCEWFIVGLIASIMTFCTVCFAEDYTPVEFKGVTLEIPSSWGEQNSTDNVRYFYPESGLLLLQFTEGDPASNYLEAENQEDFAQGMNDSGNFSVRTKAYDYIGDTLRFRYAGTFHTDEITSGYIDGVIVNAEGGSVFILMESFYDADYSNEFENILSSISEVPASGDSNGVMDVPDAANTGNDNVQDAPVEGMTRSQENALATAKNYLSFTAFSRSGLIEQLEYEGFSTEDATFAVDNCGADWFEQAYKSAENYLSFTSFSHSGLVDQLIFEGFTAEEAEYGVTQTGL